MPFMKRFSLPVLCAFLLAPISVHSETQTVQQQLIAADRGIWQAIAGPHPDIDKVMQLLAPDYLDIDSGTTNSRADVRKFLEGLTNFSFQYENPRAFALSPASGYVIAEIAYASIADGKTSKGRVLTTTVYSRESGHWLAHLHTEMEMKPAEK
jgi:hypothetical protein